MLLGNVSRGPARPSASKEVQCPVHLGRSFRTSASCPAQGGGQHFRAGPSGAPSSSPTYSCGG